MQRKAEDFQCPMDFAVSIVCGRYKALILWYLRQGTLRYSQLQRKIPKATPKVLTSQLRDLEQDGLIVRAVYPTVPPKVEYSLTSWGKRLIPVLDSLCDWGKEYMQRK